jgi:hypothetical protein
MDITAMTNTDEITIFDEIVNCGILEEDTILNFGAGYKEGQFLQTLFDYNGNFGDGSVIAVEPDGKRLKSISKMFKGERITLLQKSLQEYIDGDLPAARHWVVLTGVFNTPLYAEQQYNYVETVIRNSMSLATKGVIFTLKQNISDEFRYSMMYFFVDFANTYTKFTVKKCDDDNYIFCIYKQ